MSGPLHIVWNAFEAAVKCNPRWPAFKDLLSDILALLGNKGIRTRFIEKCLCDCPPEVRRLFWNWKHSIVDWKWEYMEEIFAKLSEALDTLLLHFDIVKMRASEEEARREVTSIDPKCLRKLELAKQQRQSLIADAEAFNIFSKNVGRASRWFTGCKCHDHIWTADATEAAKAKMFAAEVGAGVVSCIWKGRRGSELARGHWKVLAQSIREADSRTLQLRLTALPQEVQSSIVHGLDAMKCMWSEEMLAKFAYWSELPHCILGMWPHDSQSAAMARHALEKSKEFVGTEKERYMHRYAYRVVHPASPKPFLKMVEKLAAAGEMHPALGVELMEANMVATCEQPVEQMHARIFQLNASVGRNLDPPSTSARLRRGQNMEALKCWDARCFVIQLWSRRGIMQEILKPVMPQSFINVASYSEKLQAVYHCHPRQLFKSIAINKALHKKMKASVVPPKESIHTLARMAVEHLKERLPIGTIFSLPAAALPAGMSPPGHPPAPALANGDAVAVAADAGSILPHPPGGPAPFEVANVLPDAVAVVAAPPDRGHERKVGAELAGEGIFKVVKTNLQQRILQTIDIGRRGCCIAVVRVGLSRREGSQAVLTSLPSDEMFTFDLLQALEAQGVQWLFSNLTVWQSSWRTQLALTMPAFGDASSSLQFARAGISRSSSSGIGGRRWDTLLLSSSDGTSV